MFNLKKAKELQTEVTLADNEIQSLRHTLKYFDLKEFDRDIHEEMLFIAKKHKKQAEKALLNFYINNVETKDFADLLVA